MATEPTTSPMKNMPPRPTGASDPAIKVWEHSKKSGWVLKFAKEQVDDIGSEHNDQVSSVEVMSGKWELCEHAKFKGKVLTVKKGYIADLDPLDMNDKVSSLRPIDW